MATLPWTPRPDLSDTQVHHLFPLGPQFRTLSRTRSPIPSSAPCSARPRVKAVRGFSDFGYSYVYVVYEDGTDLYWARSRTAEYLSGVLSRLPEGVTTELGPDATGLGWIYQYALVDTSGQHSLADLRSYQDWYLRYYLRAVPGVADVAPSAVIPANIR